MFFHILIYFIISKCIFCVFLQLTRKKNGKETVVTVFFPFFTIISFSNFTQLLVFHTYKADIRIRFSTCQWVLLTPTDYISPYQTLNALRTRCGGMLICVQKIYNSTICFVKKYFAAPTADASFLYEQFFKYETSCSKPLYAITFSPSGII